jgi:23S rRNA G2445 N2-methylase RlmL
VPGANGTVRTAVGAPPWEWSGKRRTIVKKETGSMLITCAKGAAPFLCGELAALGYPVLSSGVSGVTTEGTIADAMRLNLFVRTGQRVLFLLREFGARGPGELYRGISAIAWEEHIGDEGYVSVTSYVDHPDVTDSRYVNLKAKDAIVDRIRERLGKRPDSGPERDRSAVSVHWKGGRCSVYLDTSGEPLSKRGYRKIPLKAPMQETLAASVVMAARWNGTGNFINPMCGSGTIAIEAALIGLGRPPGLLRTNFGFMHLKGFDRELWNAIRAGAEKKAAKELHGRIIATDVNPAALDAAMQNARAAGVAHLIEFSVCDFADTAVPGESGVVLLNPEYGERMGDARALEETYRSIGDFFKKKCGGYTGYIFTGNLGLAKKVGLRTKRRLTFFNGSIECRLLEYELYEGSRKWVKEEIKRG